tara:strand:+ start:1030 stop:1521 length:492 start_codon:yes stop_codon:yes gene_type:complete
VNYIFKTKVESHQEIKEKLLEQINQIPNNPMRSEGQNIIHTDWNLPREMHREYAKLFIETVTPHIHKMVDEFQVQEAKIDNFWFQTYGENGKHSWHTHPQTNYANVYFLECPEGYSTQFKNFQEICEEGDIISFPAFLPHCSPPIEKGCKKTVIAFNTNFICG